MVSTYYASLPLQCFMAKKESSRSLESIDSYVHIMFINFLNIIFLKNYSILVSYSTLHGYRCSCIVILLFVLATAIMSLADVTVRIQLEVVFFVSYLILIVFLLICFIFMRFKTSTMVYARYVQLFAVGSVLKIRVFYILLQ